MVAPQTLRSWIFLGVQALFVHPFRMIRRLGRPWRKQQFLANYTPERLFPVSAPDRERLSAYMRCIGCGMCDLICPLVGRLDRARFQGPSLVALAYTRATPDLGYVASTLRHLPTDCGACTRCVDVCPRRVPLKELFAYANRKLDELGKV